MIDTLHFFNHDFLGLTVLVVLMLWSLFIWKEWSSPLRFKFYLRSTVALVSLVSLAMLFLKPVFWNTTKTVKGALLTQGYQKEQLDSLIEQHKGLKRIDYDANEPFGKALDSISQLFVLGYGIPSFDFWQVKNIPTEYISTPRPSGIINLTYNKKPTVGDTLIVRGSYNATANGIYLALADPSGQEMDSVSVSTKNLHEFELSIDLKVKGNYSYKMLEKDSLGTIISSEPLPVKVLPRDNLRVLMINDFPTFESKYLKNFLAETGNMVTVRNQMTKGKFKFEYFNTKRQPFYSFAKKQLEAIDLLIIDANSFANLSKKAKQGIEDMVQGSGLGVLILPDERFFKSSSKTLGFKFLRHEIPRLQLEAWPRLIWEKYPYVYGNGSILQQVHESDDLIISAYHRNGRGRVGSTVIQNSYQVLLKGNLEAYKEFWTGLISVLGKREEPSLTWNSDSQFAYQDEPFLFKIRTSDKAPQVNGENGKIPLMQNPGIPYIWSGITYPRTTGWNSISLKTDSTNMLDFYVMDSTNWRSMAANKTRKTNERQFGTVAEASSSKRTLTPIKQIWFFSFFVLSMGYLWLAPKLVKS